MQESRANVAQTVLFVMCLAIVAWLFDRLVLDLGFDAFEEWLLAGKLA